MVAHTALSALGWTGSGNEIAQLLRPLRRQLLSLDPARISLLQQVGAAVVLPLRVAHGGGCRMQESCRCGGGEMMAECMEERSAVVRVCGERGHELGCVFPDLRERVNALLLLCRFSWLAATQC